MTHCGYLYRKARDLKNGTESWRCLNKNCRGPINVGNEIKSVSEHCHEPQPEREEKSFRAELKTRAVLTEEKPKCRFGSSAISYRRVRTDPTVVSFQPATYQPSPTGSSAED